MKWIPASEQKPPIGQKVLGWNESYICQVVYRPNYKDTSNMSYTIGDWTFPFCICCDKGDTDPIYWMLLPEEPKKTRIRTLEEPCSIDLQSTPFDLSGLLA